MSRFFIDYDAIELDEKRIKDYLNDLTSLTNSQITENTINKLLVNNSFIDFINYMIEEEISPAFIILKGNLTIEQLKFLKGLTFYKFFNKISKYNKARTRFSNRSFISILGDKDAKIETEINVLQGNNYLEMLEFASEYLDGGNLNFEELLIDAYYNNLLNKNRVEKVIE